MGLTQPSTAALKAVGVSTEEGQFLSIAYNAAEPLLVLRRGARGECFIRSSYRDCRRLQVLVSSEDEPFTAGSRGDDAGWHVLCRDCSAGVGEL